VNVTTTIVSELDEIVQDIKQLIKWENWRVRRSVVKVEERKKVEIGVELVLTYRKHKEEKEKLVDVEMMTWAKEQPIHCIIKIDKIAIPQKHTPIEVLDLTKECLKR
jgi:hypothetical protein